MLKRFAVAMLLTVAGCQAGTLDLTNAPDSGDPATTGPFTTPEAPAEPGVQVTSPAALGTLRRRAHSHAVRMMPRCVGFRPSVGAILQGEGGLPARGQRQLHRR